MERTQGTGSVDEIGGSMMSQEQATIRRMDQEDLAIAIAWAGQEGWNPGIHDGACFYACDPEGFWIAEVDGEPVALLSSVRYAARLGFLGFYLVRPDCRGMGVGRVVWRQGMDSLEGCTVGLNTAASCEAKYQKMGFQTAHHVIRYRGGAGGVLQADPYLLPLTDIPFDRVVAFDTTFFFSSREAFLASWITRPGVIALGILQDGHLAGYGVLRQAWDGFRIGPLFALNPSHAHRLYTALKAYGGEGPVYMDIPDANPNAMELAESFGMEPVKKTVRMYSGDPPSLPLSGIYGLTSLELG